MTVTEMINTLAEIGTEHDLPKEWYDDALKLISELSLSDDPEWHITLEDCIAYKKINAVSAAA